MVFGTHFKNPNNYRILVLSPHTDDGEFGCGGTISRFVENGITVNYAFFSHCDKSVPMDLPSDILKQEVMAATKVLGIPASQIISHDYPVRDFPKYRQEILEDLVKLDNELNPTHILLPSINDTHQDHQTIAQEGFRIFKKKTLLGYEVPWNNLTFVTSCFVRLEEMNLEKKIGALNCYRSQLNRSYASEEFVRSLSKMRGTQIGVPFAEVFEVVRLII